MAETRKNTNVDEVSAVLRRLSGIVEVAVASDDGQIQGVTLKTDGKRSDKYVVRDVETVLFTRFGIDLDHHAILVEQAKHAVRTETRLKIRSINSIVSGALFDVNVELEHAGKVWEGHRKGGCSKRSRLRLTSQAVIDALHGVCGPGEAISFEGLACKRVAGREVLAVVANLILTGREETVVGCAYVQRDECEAAVKATLSAVNDKLPMIIASKKV